MLKTPSLRCLRDKLFLLALVACLGAFLFCFWRATQESESAAELAKAGWVGDVQLVSLHRARYPESSLRTLNTYPAASNAALVDRRRETGSYLRAVALVRTVPPDTLASQTDRKLYWFFAALAVALLAVLLIAWYGITERKRAVAALVASEERYRLLFNANPLPILMYDATTLRYVAANETFYHQYGYSAAVLKDQRVTDRHVPKTFEALLAEVQALPLGISILKGARHIKCDGTAIDVEVTRIKTSIDGKTMVIASPIDVSDRARTEQALMASEERYRLLFNANPLPILMYDATTLRYVTANETFYHQYGYSAAELKDQRITDHHFPKKYEDLLAEIQALPLGISVLKGARHVKRDGTIFDVEVTRIRTDIDGKPMVIASAIDVTERVRAEHSVKISEERYRLLFESNPLPLWVYDLGTLKFLDVNDVACAKYGYLREEFMAMTMCDIRPPEDIAAFKQRIPHEGETRLNFGPWRHRRKDGSVIMVEINSHDVTIHGRPARFVCPIDVTEKLYAQEEIRRMNLLLESKVETRTEELARSLALQHSLFDNVPQIVWLADLNGAVTFANRVWADKIGHVAGDWKDDGWSIALHPEDLERVMREWQEAVPVKDVFEIEYRLLHRDGVYHDYQIDARRTFGQTGQPICWVGICTDVTVSRRREEALRHANQELEAFSYSVSHDLRAPLRTIDGFSERIQVEFADRLDAQSRHYLDRIRAGAANMNKLIDDLLGLSQVTRSDMAMGNVDVSLLVRQVFEELCQLEPHHRAEIVIGENMTARGDAYLLRILFVNLIGNALKFSGKREVSRIEVGESTGRGKISTFFVRDNGAGFDPAYASKMFGVFQRLHSAKEFPGSGVGLATVQRIVHRHGGHVSAQGALDKGATIHFSLRRD